MFRSLLLVLSFIMIGFAVAPAPAARPTPLLNKKVLPSLANQKAKALLAGNSVDTGFDTDGYPGPNKGEYLYGTYICPWTTYVNDSVVLNYDGYLDWYSYDPMTFNYMKMAGADYNFSWSIPPNSVKLKYGTWIVPSVGEYDVTGSIFDPNNGWVYSSMPFAIVAPASMQGFYRTEVRGGIDSCPAATGSGTYSNGSDISIVAFGGNFQNQFDPTVYLYVYLLCYDSLIDDWYPVAWDSTSVGPANSTSMPFTAYGVSPGDYKFHIAIAGGAVWTESNVFTVTP